MKPTAILIDDEYSNSEVLKYEIERLNLGIEIIGIYDDAVKAVKAIKTLKPQILFLDIKMPKLSGFEVLDLIIEEVKCNVIFVTAYNEFAVNAFQYCAIDYLVKPVRPERLEFAIKKSMDSTKPFTREILEEAETIVKEKIKVPNKIVVPIANGYQFIPLSDIIRCESDSNYTNIHLKDGKTLIVTKTLLHFEKLLSKANFLRVHQSHLINEEYILKFIKSDGGHFLMSDHTQIPISRSLKSELSNYFKGKSV